MALVSRDEVRDLLVSWDRGDLSHQQVYDWVNERFSLAQMDSGDAVVNDVLSHLDIMDVNVTTPDDVPIFLRMLDEPLEADARRMLDIYGQELDLDARFAKWRDDPFYGPFCHPVGKRGNPVA